MGREDAGNDALRLQTQLLKMVGNGCNIVSYLSLHESSRVSAVEEMIIAHDGVADGLR